MKLTMLGAAAILAVRLAAADAQNVSITFRAQVGDQAFACGHTYEGIGTTKSRISPKDFRFYIQSVALLDESGKETPVLFTPDGKWQTDSVALLDFEDGTAHCSNGTPDRNDHITGTVPPGKYRGIRFVMGVPFEQNHQDLTALPSPLNLTALSWVWNAGHKFARIEFTTTGQPRGYFLHLGSTGCMPNTTKSTIPTKCSEPNRVEVTFANFDPEKDVIVADLAELFKDSNVDQGEAGKGGGCMSSPKDSACAPIFSHLGIPFGSRLASQQDFFRSAPKTPATNSTAR